MPGKGKPSLSVPLGVANTHDPHQRVVLTHLDLTSLLVVEGAITKITTQLVYGHTKKSINNK